MKDQKSSSGGDIYRVVGRSELGKRVYKFDCHIRKHFPLIQSNDKSFLAILGYDKIKNKDCINVYHAKKGVFVHKILLKYEHSHLFDLLWNNRVPKIVQFHAKLF